MRRIKIFKIGLVLLLTLACLGVAARAQNRTVTTLDSFSPDPYRIGERLTYTVSFSNFPTAAHVEMLVAGRGQYFGREGIELRAHIETIGIVNAALYSINNDYVTYVDPATGLPYRAQQIIREGTRAADVARDFNQPVGASALASKQTAGGPYDFVAALYRMRALPLAPGATYSLTAQQETHTYNGELKINGREVVKTNVGSSNTLAAQLRVRSDAAADYRLRINFTDDPRHIPVLIAVMHPAGEIRAELASAEITSEAPLPLAGTTPGANPVVPQQPGIPLPNQAANPPGNTPANPASSPTPAPGTAAATNADSLPADLPFKVGEQLNFTFFAGTNQQAIGTASFHVRARARYFNRDGLLLTSALQTNGVGARLFPVNDQFSSYVDAASLLPFRTEVNVQEGQRRARWIISLDQESGSALFDDGTRLEMRAATHDLISVFYALRSFDLTVGRRNAVALLLNKRPRLLFVTALRRATLALGTQQIPAIELSLTTDEVESDRFALRLWVSSDSRRLPLRLTAQTPLGPVRADLAILPTSLQ